MDWCSICSYLINKPHHHCPFCHELMTDKEHQCKEYIARTTEDATQNSLEGEQLDDDKVEANR